MAEAETIIMLFWKKLKDDDNYVSHLWLRDSTPVRESVCGLKAEENRFLKTDPPGTTFNRCERCQREELPRRFNDELRKEVLRKKAQQV